MHVHSSVCLLLCEYILHKSLEYYHSPPGATKSTDTPTVSGSNRVSMTHTVMVSPSVPANVSEFNENDNVGAVSWEVTAL